MPAPSRPKTRLSSTFYCTSSAIAMGLAKCTGSVMKKHNSFLITTIVACLMVVNANATTQTAVALGSNSTFVALAATTVTVTGGGTITGTVGISPGTAFVAGNPATTVNGTICSGGTVAAQAEADLTTAYND